MLTYETGTFTVDSSGEIQVDFLFDGGWFKGELGVFSLDGMDDLEPGSPEFILEAAERAESNSELGSIVIKDRKEGALFGADLSHESNFNRGEYQGSQTFNLVPNDEVGLILIPNATFAGTLKNPDNISRFGRLPIVSIPEANINEAASDGIQFVAADNNGTVALVDLPVAGDRRDYNDLIFQVQGLTGDLPDIDNLINSELDWRDEPFGAELMAYASDVEGTINIEPEEPKTTPKEPEIMMEEIPGSFMVGNNGEVTVDYLFDGGFLHGEVGIFSLEDLNPEEFGSPSFEEEVLTRVQSNSTQGHTVISDADEGARFSFTLPWEQDFNRGEYQEARTFELNKGDSFGLVLVSDGTFAEYSQNPETDSELLFSIPGANFNSVTQVANVQTSGMGSITSFEDNVSSSQSAGDFNDLVLGISGAKPMGINAIADLINENRNWLDTEVGEDILSYFNDVDS